MRTQNLIDWIETNAAAEQGSTSKDILLIEISLRKFAEQYFNRNEQSPMDVKAHSIKAVICASLKSVSGDVFELSKVLGTIFLGLEAVGKLAMPLTPLYVAGAAIFLARGGLAALCSDVKTS